jgi:hypothetical protein
MFHSISYNSLVKYTYPSIYSLKLEKLKQGVTYIAVVGKNSVQGPELHTIPTINVIYTGPWSINTSKEHKDERKRLRQQIIIFELCEQQQVDAQDVQKEDKTPVVTT